MQVSNNLLSGINHCAAGFALIKRTRIHEKLFCLLKDVCKTQPIIMLLCLVSVISVQHDSIPSDQVSRSRLLVNSSSLERCRPTPPACALELVLVKT